jgi:hypothetical protein
MKTKIIFSLALAIIFLTIPKVQSQPGCPGINAGPDQTLICTASCANLTSTVLGTGATTSYAVSSIPYAPPYPFSTGSPILVNIDDMWSNPIQLPFTFCFWGNSYTQLEVGSNGLISFGTNSGFCQGTFSASCPNALLVGGSVGPFIFGAYEDMDPSVQGTISYALLGTYPCRTIVVNWNQISLFGCNYLVATSQIVLYENTNIVEVYIQNKPLCSSWNNGNALIGIQDAVGANGVVAPGRQTGQWTASNEAWRFTPDGTPNYNTYWYEGFNLIATNTPIIQVCPTSITTYTAQVVYDGCDGSQVTLTDDVIISIANPTPTIYCDSNIIVCNESFPYYQWYYNNDPIPGQNGQVCMNVGTGNYYVIATDIYGCTGVSNTCFNTYSGFPCSAQFTIVPDSVILHHYYVLNNASGSAPLTYLWSWGDGTYDSIAYPSHTYSTAGNYTICLNITDFTGCVSASCDSSYLQKSTNDVIYVDVVSEIITELNNNELTDQINIYPNPATYNLTIETLQKSTIEIISIHGQLIKTLATGSTKTNIDVSALPCGVYIVEVKTEKGMAVRKFVKE